MTTDLITDKELAEYDALLASKARMLKVSTDRIELEGDELTCVHYLSCQDNDDEEPED